MTDWLRVETTTGGIHLYPLPDLDVFTASEPDLQTRADLIEHLRDRHGIPADWMSHPDRGTPTMRHAHGAMKPPTGNGWDVAIIGDPHPSLRDLATVHDTTGDA